MRMHVGVCVYVFLCLLVCVRVYAKLCQTVHGITILRTKKKNVCI